jgi:Transglycosylase SLT domain
LRQKHPPKSPWLCYRPTIDFGNGSFAENNFGGKLPSKCDTFAGAFRALAGERLSIPKQATTLWRLGAFAAWTIFVLPNAAVAAEPVFSRQLVCQTIADAAAANGLPANFLARLLWTESGFRSSAISPAGAIGVAQFMPQTAAEQGLADPRDPLEAIYHAARLLIELDRHFGNLGLAAAAYNAGAARVTKWLQGQSELPLETEVYVRAITGRRAEDWATIRGTLAADDSFPLPGLDCLNLEVAHVTHVGPFPKPAAWQLRLDSHLATAIDLSVELLRPDPRSSAPARPTTPAYTESLCEAVRARGIACQVFDR